MDLGSKADSTKIGHQKEGPRDMKAVAVIMTTSPT